MYALIRVDQEATDLLLGAVRDQEAYCSVLSRIEIEGGTRPNGDGVLGGDAENVPG